MWAKQTGEAWVLQRAGISNTGPQEKLLQLSVMGPLSIEDAKFLVTALEREIEAARLSERGPQVRYKVHYPCRKCGQPIDGRRFGAADKGWQHLEGECPAPPPNHGMLP